MSKERVFVALERLIRMSGKYYRLALCVVLMGGFPVFPRSFSGAEPSPVYRDEESHFYDSHKGPRAITLDYPFLYLVGGEEEDIKVLNVENPTSPVLCSRIPMKEVRDLHAHENVLYVCSQGTLAVVDCSDPMAPRIEIKNEPDKDTSHTSPYEQVHMAGDYLLVTSQVNIHLFDLSNPLAPTMVSEFRPKGRIERVAAGDGFACVAAGYHNGPAYSLMTWEDPRKITALIDFELGGGPQCSWENRLLLSGGDARGLELMDMSDPANPKLVSYTEGMPGKLIKCGDILFGLEGFDGFSAVDLSDETNPKQIMLQRRYHEYGPWDMATHGEILYVVHIHLGLRFYDVSDPAKPVLIYESCPKSHAHPRPTDSTQ